MSWELRFYRARGAGGLSPAELDPFFRAREGFLRSPPWGDPPGDGAVFYARADSEGNAPFEFALEPGPAEEPALLLRVALLEPEGALHEALNLAAELCGELSLTAGLSAAGAAAPPDLEALARDYEAAGAEVERTLAHATGRRRQFAVIGCGLLLLALALVLAAMLRR